MDATACRPWVSARARTSSSPPKRRVVSRWPTWCRSSSAARLTTAPARLRFRRGARASEHYDPQRTPAHRRYWRLMRRQGMTWRDYARVVFVHSSEAAGQHNLADRATGLQEAHGPHQVGGVNASVVLTHRGADTPRLNQIGDLVQEPVRGLDVGGLKQRPREHQFI